jgi:hypothetical protein
MLPECGSPVAAFRFLRTVRRAHDAWGIYPTKLPYV